MTGRKEAFEPESGAILTLEPLVELVRGTIESGGWLLSGVQKTTSYEYGGRWEGDSTRSAYLFFHREESEGGPSLDVFLDETSRGLTGNLALVVPGPGLSALGDVQAALARLASVTKACTPSDLRTPLTVRARLDRAESLPGTAEVEFRVKVLIRPRVILAGKRVVAAVVRAALTAFADIAAHPDMAPLMGEG